MKEPRDEVWNEHESPSLFLVLPKKVLFQPWIFLEVARFLPLHDILSLGSCNRAAQEALHSETWQAPFWDPLISLKCCSGELTVNSSRNKKSASRFLRYYFQLCTNWQKGYAVLKTLVETRRNRPHYVDNTAGNFTVRPTSRAPCVSNSAQRRTPKRTPLGGSVVSNSLAVFLHTGVSTFGERGRASSLIVIDLAWDPVDFSVILWCNEDEQNRRWERLKLQPTTNFTGVDTPQQFVDLDYERSDDDSAEVEASSLRFPVTQRPLVSVVPATYCCQAVKSVASNELFFLLRNEAHEWWSHSTTPGFGGGTPGFGRVANGPTCSNRRPGVTVTPSRTLKAGGLTEASNGRRFSGVGDDEDLDVVSLRYANANAVRPLSGTAFKGVIVAASRATLPTSQLSSHSACVSCLEKGRLDSEDCKFTPGAKLRARGIPQLRPSTACTSQFHTQSLEVTSHYREINKDDSENGFKAKQSTPQNNSNFKSNNGAAPHSDDGFKENRAPPTDTHDQPRRSRLLPNVRADDKSSCSCNNSTGATSCRRLGNICFTQGVLASICVEGSDTAFFVFEKAPVSNRGVPPTGVQGVALNYYLDLLVVDPSIAGIGIWERINRSISPTPSVGNRSWRHDKAGTSLSPPQGANRFFATGRMRLVPSLSAGGGSNMNDWIECFGRSPLVEIFNTRTSIPTNRTPPLLGEVNEQMPVSVEAQASHEVSDNDFTPLPRQRLPQLDFHSGGVEISGSGARDKTTEQCSYTNTGADIAVVGVSTRVAYGRGRIYESNFRSIGRLHKEVQKNKEMGTAEVADITVVLSNFKLPQTHYSACISLCGNYIVLGGGDGALSLVEVLPSGVLFLKQRNSVAHRAAISGVSFRNSVECGFPGSRTCTGDNRHWLPAIRAVKQSFDDIQQTRKPRSECASCSLDTCVKLWDARVSLEDPIAPSALHQDGILCVCFGGSDDSVVLSGSTNGLVTAWDTRFMVMPLFVKDFSDAGAVVELQADSRSCLVECRTVTQERRIFLMDFSADAAEPVPPWTSEMSPNNSSPAC